MDDTDEINFEGDSKEVGVTDEEILAAPIKVSRRDIDKQVAREARELRERREAKLKQLREEQQIKAQANSSASAENRLAFLMQQAELFTHFVHGGTKSGGPSGSGGESSAPAPRGRRGKKSSAEDEDEDGLAAEGEFPGPRIIFARSFSPTQNPPCHVSLLTYPLLIHHAHNLPPPASQLREL